MQPGLMILELSAFSPRCGLVPDGNDLASRLDKIIGPAPALCTRCAERLYAPLAWAVCDGVPFVHWCAPRRQVVTGRLTFQRPMAGLLYHERLNFVPARRLTEMEDHLMVERKHQLGLP